MTYFAKHVYRLIGCLEVLVLLNLTGMGAAQPSTRPTSAPRRYSLGGLLNNTPDEWFATAEGQRVMDNLVAWQTPFGGWWKAYAIGSEPDRGPTTDPAAGGFDRPNDTGEIWHQTATIDNGATYHEIRILAKAYRITQKDLYRDSSLRGIKYLLDAQYANGGWPQRFPLQDNYGRHITFNDLAMLQVMNVMRDAGQRQGDFSFIDEALAQRAQQAFDRGIDCMLKCQIRVKGKLTGWCAQHDEVTLAPAGARTYELPSISGGAETARNALLLMSLPNPDERVKQAVQGVVTWYATSRIKGYRYTTVSDPSVRGGRDRRLVEDPGNPGPWARFYEIETNRPMFVGRDGVKRWKLSEIEAERRNGYAYAGNWGQAVLDAYPKWAEANGLPTTLPASGD
jgi:PelA/Pel-15E family pectate lyase